MTTATARRSADGIQHIDEDVVRAQAWFDLHGDGDLGKEAWLYTPVAAIGARLAEVSPAEALPADLATVDALAGRHGEVRLVLVNGELSPDASDLDGVPVGVRVGSDDGAVHVAIEAGTVLDSPIHVVHVASPTGARARSDARLVVDAGAASSSRLVESFVGLAGGAVTGTTTTVRVDRDAHVTHHRLQIEPDDSIHVGRVRFEQQSGSNVRSNSITHGADISRLTLDVVFAGEGATCDLQGAYLPTGSQRHDTLVTVDHGASHCSSNQLFKGVVGDRARGSFSGHVIVQHGTVATDAHQTNRNLLLAPTAQADSRPWLEIFADDVRCDHGSATGRLDEEALFYLRSRGIPRARARALLIEAFVREITSTITPPSLREQVETILELEGA